MPSVVILQGGSLDSLYKFTMETIHRQHYNQPTNLIELPKNEEELSRISYYDALGQYVVGLEHSVEGGNYQG